MIEDVYKNGLCSGCGTCVGTCPSDAIALRKTDDGMYKPVVDYSKCDLCGLCLKVCPKYPQNFTGMNEFVFNRVPQDFFLGNTGYCYLGHTLDEEIRWKSSVGGLITTLLVFALEEGIIDGAIVVRMRDNDPLEPEIILARNRMEIISASGPKFCPVPVNIKIKDVLNEKGKFAFVGLPCHIQGLRKAEMFNKQLREKVILHLGNFCCHNVSFLGTDFLIQKLNIPKRSIARIDYRARKKLGGMGGFLVKLKNGKEFFIKSSRYWGAFGAFFFTPVYCLLCPDHTSEFADISFGNAWVLRHQLDGEHTNESIIISRTEMGEKILQSALSRGKIWLTRINRDIVVQSQEGDLLFKKKSLDARIYFLRHLRKNIPTSDLQKPTFISYLGSMLVYLSVYASSKSSLRNKLKWIPLSLLRAYQLALYAFFKFLS